MNYRAAFIWLVLWAMFPLLAYLAGNTFPGRMAASAAIMLPMFGLLGYLEPKITEWVRKGKKKRD